jgi:phosphoribosylanthranilate isomerase
VIKAIIEYCGIDLVQLHGDESPEICEELLPRSIKALKVKNDSIVAKLNKYKGKVKAFLLDTYSDKMAGGTGKIFDWDIAIKIKETGIPVILAGGIGPLNIEEAISRVKPYAVDISSGIEESPGKKSKALMEELFEKIKRQESGDRSQE